MSYVSSDNTSRTFSDDAGRVWTAERVGRTSGIVSTGKHPSLPEPADIIRFSCQSDPEETERETTIQAGSLDELTKPQMLHLLRDARQLRSP